MDSPDQSARVGLTEAPGFVRRPRMWDWEAFLTADERREVAAAIRRQEDARRALAEATAFINPIRNRAIHRAKDAAGRRALQEPEPDGR